MEKYRFACTYCFPEEVWNLRDMAEVAIDWCFKKEPLLIYWSKHLTNQLHTIPVPANDSIDEIMFAKALNEFDLWQPIKYFFEKLNSGDRLLQSKNVVSHKRGKYQKQLLALLNECEKTSVYQANLKKIIKNYDKVYDFESIRQIYTELKGKLSFKNFALIFKKLASLSMQGLLHFNALTPLLMEIWNDASMEYKVRVASSGLRSRIVDKWYDLIMENEGYYYENRDQFRNPFVLIRALAEVDEPRNFLKSNFDWLVVWQPFASIVKLIDEFQFNAEDVEELKNDIRQSDTMEGTFSGYLRCGEFGEFSSIISFCYSDDNASKIAYQRKFLMENLDSLSLALMSIDWKIIYEFVNNVFCDTDGDDGFESSCTTLLMQNALKKGMYVLDRMMHLNEANSIVECIETFVPHHDNLSRAKKACIDLLSDHLHNGYLPTFKETQIEEILTWCYGSETGVAEFKEKINVSEAFINMLEGCVNGYTFKASDSMEEFLHWYYPIESERKAFKLEMIYSYGEFETIGELLKGRMYRPRAHLMKWFFENDDCKIMEFITKIYLTTCNESSSKR
ncbi:uncharacterized protein LOC135834572 [Planococcus citri]|uniref:uncharacterized protein LOC135834572 n=1 Tax=Planococcus citri TaxID=170843 RepID=UPI0031F9AA57